MTVYDLAGHPVSLDVTQQDLELFRAAARTAVSGEAARAGLNAVLPGLLDRVGAQLHGPGLVGGGPAKCGHTYDQHGPYGCTVDYPAPCWCGTPRRRLSAPWNEECAP